MTQWNPTRAMVDAHAELFMGAESAGPCSTCDGEGLLSNEAGDPHCWFCSGEACALCYGARQSRECEHDVIDRHGNEACRDICPDCHRPAPPTIAGSLSFPADADQPDPVRCGAGSTVAARAVDVPQRPARRPAGEADVPPIVASPATIGSLRVRARCECGASFDATSNPPAAIERIYDAWNEEHQGEGHRRLPPGERRPRKFAQETDSTSNARLWASEIARDE